MNYIESLIGFEVPTAVWLGVGLFLALLARGLTDWWLKRNQEHLAGRAVSAGLNAVRPFLVPVVLLLMLRVAIVGRLIELSDGVSITVDNTAFVIWALIALIAVIRLISNYADWYAHDIAHRTETQIDDQILPFVHRITVAVATTIALVAIFARFGVNVSGLVATLGVGTLAIALAAQTALTDTISGILIMLDRPFRIGDRIEIRDLGTWGDVTDIGLRTTRIRARDNRLVIIPNSVIGKNLVVNHSIPDSSLRVETHVGIAYGSDIERARKVMIDAVRAQDWVKQDERVEALFLEFGDSALIFRVRCWIGHYVETRRLIDKLNTCLYLALREAEITIPFPTRTVDLRGSSATAVLDAVDRRGAGTTPSDSDIAGSDAFDSDGSPDA